MLTFLNKTFSIEILEYLIRDRTDEFECDSIRDSLRIVIQNSENIHHFNSLINCEFENDFHFDFVEHRHCVSCIDSSIDSNRDDQNRTDFDLNKNRFEHLSNDSNEFRIRI